MAATDVERLRRALSDVDFPADKTDLVRSADQAGADDETVRALKAVPPVTYANFQELLQAVPLQQDRSRSDQAARRRMHTKPGLSQYDKDVPGHPIADEVGENRKS
jgi:Protein of unknown function (DUF2795)